MPRLEGSTLHHAVACRIVERYLSDQGARHIRMPSVGSGEGESIDVTAVRSGGAVRIKVKADAYCGTDPIRIADRGLPFYRRQGSDYAFEAVSHSSTRRPGWVFRTNADDLYYYFLALGQTQDEISALYQEPDDVFFSELAVDRDELHVIGVEALREWFDAHFEQYTPRPVLVGEHSAWFRLVPRDVLRQAVPVRVEGPIFAATARP